MQSHQPDSHQQLEDVTDPAQWFKASIQPQEQQLPDPQLMRRLDQLTISHDQQQQQEPQQRLEVLQEMQELITSNALQMVQESQKLKVQQLLLDLQQMEQKMKEHESALLQLQLKTLQRAKIRLGVTQDNTTPNHHPSDEHEECFSSCRPRDNHPDHSLTRHPEGSGCCFTRRVSHWMMPG